MKKRLTFYETMISILLDIRSAKSQKWIGLFIFGTVVSAWFIQLSYNIISACSTRLYQRYWVVGSNDLVKAMVANILPLVLFLGFMAIIYYVYKKNSIKETLLESNIPEKHRGLVAILSQIKNCDDYRKTNAGESLIDDLKRDDSLGKIRSKIFGSNWGPLLYAVEYHKEKLQQCWLVCSTGDDGSINDFNTASLMIKKIVSNCDVHLVEFTDPLRIDEKGIECIKDVLKRDSNEFNLAREDVIFDFTGGTAAMSGSMILATIDDDISIEYFRQDRNLVMSLDEKGGYLPDYLDKDGQNLLPLPDKCHLLAVETKRSIIKE